MRRAVVLLVAAMALGTNQGQAKFRRGISHIVIAVTINAKRVTNVEFLLLIPEMGPARKLLVLILMTRLTLGEVSLILVPMKSAEMWALASSFRLPP